MISTSLKPGQSAPAGDGTTEQIWVGLLIRHMLGTGFAEPLRHMSSRMLRHLAVTIGRHASTLPDVLASLRLPQLETPTFWVADVLPGIKRELERRSRPKRVWGANSPIARLKSLDIGDVASRFTTLTGSGNRLKGLCPLHQEKTPSFYVYLDRQRWRCYGGCAEGGDVVDLLRRLGDQGKLK